MADVENDIRAIYSARSIRVYQAFCPEIAKAALRAGRFVAPFQMGRMTWIKPSFNWMMYRSAYGSRPGQEVVLGIDIMREGFEWALDNSVLSMFNQSVHASYESWRELLASTPVRIQWDPERDWRLRLISGLRTIQIGLSGEALERYVADWIVHIENMTSIVREISFAAQRNHDEPPFCPSKFERPYPIRSGSASSLLIKKHCGGIPQDAVVGT